MFRAPVRSVPRLVILHVDTVDTLQGVADVRVGELADLVGRHDVGYVKVILLSVYRTALSVERSFYLNALKLHSL